MDTLNWPPETPPPDRRRRDGGDPPPRVRLYRRRRRPARWMWRALIALLLLALIAALAIFLWARPKYLQAQSYDLEEVNDLERASHIYDRHSKEIGRIYVENRWPVSRDKFPPHLIDALIAAEDGSFRRHDGVDYKGIVRALLRNFLRRGRREGASTITQQLARQSFGLTQRSYERKLIEAFLARRIEKRFSKDEILERYLNRIYFGSGFYGANAATLGYFGKSVDKINAGEAAMLCGIIKAPARLSPLKDPEGARVERDYVLWRMTEEGYLSEGEKKRLQAEPLIISPGAASRSGRLDYFQAEVRKRVIATLGYEAAASGGFRIYTTLDQRLQRAAETALAARLDKIEAHPGRRGRTHADYRQMMTEFTAQKSDGMIAPDAEPPPPDYLQGAALISEAQSGAVLAMVGGRDFRDSEFNRALQSKRPAATAFSTFVYAAAFDSGARFPLSTVQDFPVDNVQVNMGGLRGALGEWGMEVPEPEHLNRPIPLRQALAEGKNAATFYLGQTVGLDAVRKIAKSLGIVSTIEDVPASFLGASPVRLSELVLAYGAFSTGGRRPSALRFIYAITDAEGRPVADSADWNPDPKRDLAPAMDPVAAWQTHTCLSEALRIGPPARVIQDLGFAPPVDSSDRGAPFHAGVKTGSSHNFQDAWALGYTSSIVCGVWIGQDRNEPIHPNAFGADTALPLWADLMSAASEIHPPGPIEPPADAPRIEICRESSLPATDRCYETENERQRRWTRFEIVRPRAQLLRAHCEYHGGAPSGPLPEQRITEFYVRPEQQGVLAAATPAIIPRQPSVIGDDPYQSRLPAPKAVALPRQKRQIGRAHV